MLEVVVKRYDIEDSEELEVKIKKYKLEEFESKHITEKDILLVVRDYLKNILENFEEQDAIE